MAEGSTLIKAETGRPETFPIIAALQDNTLAEMMMTTTPSNRGLPKKPVQRKMKHAWCILFFGG
jgi:hypothetical protein